MNKDLVKSVIRNIIGFDSIDKGLENLGINLAESKLFDFFYSTVDLVLSTTLNSNQMNNFYDYVYSTLNCSFSELNDLDIEEFILYLEELEIENEE